ncbi:MAG TPA: lysylphosphatidylglycerol synthase transmembrane domain-containing protein [Candidatus Kapabacteria bacterium]|nr:lysylphosphatidylglycerol synthase transmembrane domain-containing protein [Candidatus Kapabacteria bacterium]
MSRSSAGRILQGALALVGLGLFISLVREIDWAAIDAFAPSSVLVLVATIAVLAVINYTFDTLSWWLTCGPKRPSFLALTSLRLRCEAVTNILPGGAMIGEPMKVALLVESAGMTRAEAATSFLLSKFAIICGHIGYVVVGIALSYSLVNRASDSVFGTADVATLALAIALGLFVVLLAMLAAMVWVRPMARWLLPSRRQGRWHGRWNTLVAELQRVEELVGDATRNGAGRLALALACGFIAWSFNAIEAYVILRWIGVELGFADVYAIDAVSSIVRMILFVVPIGIGGQDWAITGLMTAHGVAAPVQTSAALVLFKRGREFAVVAIGLVMLLAAARVRRPAVVEEAEAPAESEAPV